MTDYVQFSDNMLLFFFSYLFQATSEKVKRLTAINHFMLLFSFINFIEYQQFIDCFCPILCIYIKKKTCNVFLDDFNTIRE